MNNRQYTPQQQVLAQRIAKMIDHSGCNMDQCLEIMTDVSISLMASKAPTRDELIAYFDNTFIPYYRSNVIGFYDMLTGLNN